VRAGVRVDKMLDTPDAPAAPTFLRVVPSAQHTAYGMDRAYRMGSRSPPMVADMIAGRIPGIQSWEQT